MLAQSFKRTKIVATIGPASASLDVLEGLIRAGINAARVNMSHGTKEEHAQDIKNVRELAERAGKPVAIIVDLQGPKIRIGTLPTTGVALVRGAQISLGYGTDYERSHIIPVQHDISKHVREGQMLLLRDGQIRLRVTSVSKGIIHATVNTPGILLSSHGINLPDTDLGGEIFTDKDLEDIKFAKAQDADYVALSFVQTSADINSLRRKLNRIGCDAHIIAKVETKAAMHNIEAIVQASDAVMVARGDLAVEAGPETVPVAQAKIAELGRLHNKLVIVATQMLDSMTEAPSPTRAEVNDVASAVTQRVDAVMTSGETAIGKFPVETIKMMKSIITYTEQHIENQPVKLPKDIGSYNAIAQAATKLADQIGAKAIVAGTTSGQTALNLASYRPSVPIMVATDNVGVYRRLAILWGSKAFFTKHLTLTNDAVIKELKEAGNIHAGDAVVVAYGHQKGVVGGTDTVQIKVVE